MIENGALDKALSDQRKAFEVDISPSLATRRDRLNRIGQLLKENSQALCEAVSSDFGHRSHYETTMLELVPLMGALRHTRSHLKRWMKVEPRARSIEFMLLGNYVQYQPLGVVGIMVPWNYPVFLALGPLIDVLAAGNRAIIKPSELAPATSALLSALIGKYFSAEEVLVVEGGADVAAAFSALAFDHLIFTGSTAVGKKVMAAAAAHLTPLTLELGGKSPALIAPDYDTNSAARDIVFGKLMNAGQTCIAPDYVLVEKSRLESLVDALVAEVQRRYPSESSAENYTSVLGERSYARLTEVLRECESRGARVVTADIALPKRGRSIAPTFVINPPADCTLMEEEIFGPVLPIIPYEKLDEAIVFIRARPRPLALYLFTGHRATERSVLEKTISGNVTVNGTLLHVAQNDLPFGGVGPSGLGAYHGHDGFKRFSHARGISKVYIFNPARLAMPPYGFMTRLLARLMGRG
ncbi:coniferyl aldehyde dehydrogenase [Agrobacterium larrymoorei]|uniref:Aldehyde dehydrogenase n=1 Tax=Agrobacterium larrymoorei TaxID=160699 RepID=A0AAF0KEP3_9HYPH|nr:coniferyl aldehyde dehydrogenase [Agrobacterium larrymoorei]WHA42595.1 coniferyl aldehyde dehydrogenase [Agrobacterium larrymoorei]